VTSHVTVTATVYAPPAAAADERRYTCPQSGDAFAGSVPGFHAVPGPAQVTVVPSPIDQVAFVGRAVAVTLTPGTDAVADCGLHDAGFSASHTGRLTSWSPGGFIRITTAGSFSRARACRANTAGEIVGGAPGIHTMPPNPLSGP
jgi:hypothetical protein